MNNPLEKDLKEERLRIQLEFMIDEYGLDTVLERLSEVCEEKSEHIWYTWQDVELAKSWDTVSKSIREVSDNFGVTI